MHISTVYTWQKKKKIMRKLGITKRAVEMYGENNIFAVRTVVVFAIDFKADVRKNLV